MAKPLDPTAFLKDPCALLSDDQRAQLHITGAGEPDADSNTARVLGPACTWNAAGGTGWVLEMSFMRGRVMGSADGLSDLYRNQTTYAYFEPTTVDGYPAAFYDSPDGREQGSCQLGVGITDKLVFRAGAHEGSRRGAAACDDARELAVKILATLQHSG